MKMVIAIDVTAVDENGNLIPDEKSKAAVKKWVTGLLSSERNGEMDGKGNAARVSLVKVIATEVS